MIRRLINNEDAYHALDLMRSIAAAHDAPVPQIALAWLLAKPTITAPIIGARRVEQLDDTIGAAELALSGEELRQLDAATAMF